MRPNNPVIFAGISASVNQTSAAIPTDFMIRYSAQASFTGTPNGTIQVQVSNDKNNGITPTNWSNLGSAVSVSSGALTLIPYAEICYAYMRFIWTNSSSTGTITLNMFAIGA